MKTLPGDVIPAMEHAWILAYVLVVLVGAFAAAWYLDKRDNDRADAERMRQHLDAMKNRRDTYLDPQGWNQ